MESQLRRKACMQQISFKLAKLDGRGQFFHANDKYVLRGVNSTGFKNVVISKTI